ncbi:uncharacterized protein Z518_04012 [Rhinocladiella mackenziei CBS 650.93]|uniref:Uncharacterized protein n=1 Tax=Rhinocladiella mackenziei CBS 650.93 TaxID=1442369 RepID=A0A0D2H6N5_9EURO|nr:uncharacterized protein Z518_04012 [Rhinocladiella mackenziei CBS 650.93]KIX06038.1 hypothetical protein Z518_04012 [Rhinocladiella mackenziei CBS 650.93]
MMVSSQVARVGGWVCAGLSLVILIVRVVAARIQHGSFDISTVVCVTAILVISARIGINQYVLAYGTSNDALYGKGQYFDSHDLDTIKIGSILALVQPFWNAIHSIYIGRLTRILDRAFERTFNCLPRASRTSSST